VAKRTRVVVKVGTSTLSDAEGRVDRAYLSELVEQIVALRDAGTDVVLVSSGAIAAGVERLGLGSRPTDIPTLQAVASVGQVRIIGTYAELFAERGVPIGQVLLTRQDTAHRQQYVHACHTFDRLIARRVVPVVNENDTTAVDEIRFGDNDNLAALVGIMVKADLVVLLSDTGGLYTADPRHDGEASLYERVEELTDEHVAAAGGPGSGLGSGGMATKLEAARALMKAGIPMVVCDGRRDGILRDAVAGEPVGTLFAGGETGVTGRKLWIAYAGRPAGSIRVDDGARDALCLRGKSLLPAGVTDVTGSFAPGDPVAITDRSGTVIARGLTSLSSEDLGRVKGMNSAEIGKVAPEVAGTEVVHRDHLVIL
jgi:glutamate 5-kinase